jgi:hypothetical protein
VSRSFSYGIIPSTDVQFMLLSYRTIASRDQMARSLVPWALKAFCHTI